MPNTLDASDAMQQVLDRYETYLPAGLAPKIRSMNPSRIFRILPAAKYKPYFDAVFRNFFAAINVSACGGTKEVIGVANDSKSAFDNFACPAFCAPAVNVTDRVIYVNRDAGVTISRTRISTRSFMQWAGTARTYSKGSPNTSPEGSAGTWRTIATYKESTSPGSRRSRGTWAAIQPLRSTAWRSWPSREICP
jgi:hypothetical protein